MFRRIDHVALHVSDQEKSVRFYENNFGFQLYADSITPSGVQIVYLKLGDTVLELSGFSEGKMQGFHFCLETENFDDAVKKLVRKGVIMESEPHNTSPRTPSEKGWRRVVFLGLDGEKIEVRGR